MLSPRLLFPVRRSICLFVGVLGVLATPVGNGGSAWAQATSAPSTQEPAPLAADAPREGGGVTPRTAPLPATSGNGAPPVPGSAPQFDANPQMPVTTTPGGTPDGAETYPNAGKAAMPGRRAVLEARMRDLMTQMGIVSFSTQDAILAFMSADEEGKRQVREAGRKLLVGIRRSAPPERLKTLLSEYQSAIEGEQARRQHAQTALDAQVGYSLDARLESLLWLLGVLGQGQSAFGPGAFGPGSDAQARTGASDVQSSELAGEITAKSGAGEALPWLEIRDEGGHLWRLKPGAAPAARQVLARQINALSLGARVTVRVGTPIPIPLLLAIIPDDADPNPVLTP